MTFVSLRSLHATPIKHHDRGLTLVFGSDGQFSLIGGEIPSLPIPIPPVLTAGIPIEPTSVSPIPKLDATSVSLSTTPSLTPTPTTASITSPPTSSSFSSSSSSTTTSSNTNNPSVPTASYTTPTPSTALDSDDHGVGAPFYLAIVLASISFVGCIAALVAWWIRSRARKRDLELEDPWHRRDALPDAESSSTDNAHGFEKGVHTDLEAQTRPYYLPASIVRRGSPDSLTVPHTIPNLRTNAPQSGIPPALTAAGRYPTLHRMKDPRFQISIDGNGPLSQTNSIYSRPSTARIDTGLSVQESTRTLGRLRITNRVPGDVTSGDEGGINLLRAQSSAGVSSFPKSGGPDAVLLEENATQNSRVDQSDRPIQANDTPLEPPGPATIPWGRRTDTIAALRRSRRRTPETTVQTHKNPRYGGYWYPTLDGEPSTIPQGPDTINGEENRNKVPADPLSDPLGWKGSLKSSFWQAVDAVKGNRPTVPELHAANAGTGSTFTPAPQRVASRRSPASPTHISGLPHPSTPTTRSQEADTKYELTPPEKFAVTQETPPNTCSRSGSCSTNQTDPDARLDSLPPRVSRLNLCTSSYRRHPESLRAETGSVYSTDSTIARANLRKYGYGDPIPSSWSALGARRESQLDLERMHAPLPLPIPSPSPGPLSITPSRLTLESGHESSFMRTRTRASARTSTPTRSPSDATGSDVSTIRSGKPGNPTMTSDAETRSTSTNAMSRNDTMQSGRSTIDHEMGIGSTPLASSSATPSALSRKKGVATWRKRPRLPRAPSNASSVQSIESGLSMREAVVRKALLERRRKVKAAENRQDNLTTRSGDVNVGSALE